MTALLTPDARRRLLAFAAAAVTLPTDDMQAVQQAASAVMNTPEGRLLLAWMAVNEGLLESAYQPGMTPEHTQWIDGRKAAAAAVIGLCLADAVFQPQSEPPPHE